MFHAEDDLTWLLSACLQEVFVDPNRDESIIVELLEMQDDVNDRTSASWFLEDLATEQDSKEDLVCSAPQTMSPLSLPLLLFQPSACKVCVKGCFSSSSASYLGYFLVAPLISPLHLIFKLTRKKLCCPCIE